MILIALGPWDKQILTKVKSAEVKSDADLKTAHISHVDAVDLWCTRSAGIRLDMACELFFRWPEMCPVADIVKLDQENSKAVSFSYTCSFPVYILTFSYHAGHGTLLV